MRVRDKLVPFVSVTLEHILTYNRITNTTMSKIRTQTKFYNQLGTDMKRYKELKKKFFPNGESFVEQTDDPEWSEYNVLSIKLTPVLCALSTYQNVQP